jgi:hypothetical protein|tara:strand:+ start:801 stop:1118 length:318 start_codon:yes stop_codon:yes gene_type:complete
MLRFNSFDMSGHDQIDLLLEYLGQPAVTQDDVWVVARVHTDIPIFENILWELTLNILKKAILHANPWLQHKDIQTNINCADTNIKILGDTISDVASYNSILNKHK